MSEEYTKNYREWKRLVKLKINIPMKYIEITAWNAYGVYYYYYKSKFHKLLGIKQNGYMSFRKTNKVA